MAHLKYGVTVEWQDSFSQVLAGAQANGLYDRDDELFIFSTEADQEKFIQFLQFSQLSGEKLNLIEVEDIVHSPAFTDYGFYINRNGYLYAHMVAIFTFKAHGNDKDTAAARMQMEEHFIVSFEDKGKNMHVVDQELRTLMDGISSAYRCKIDWL